MVALAGCRETSSKTIAVQEGSVSDCNNLVTKFSLDDKQLIGVARIFSGVHFFVKNWRPFSHRSQFLNTQANTAKLTTLVLQNSPPRPAKIS